MMRRLWPILILTIVAISMVVHGSVAQQAEIKVVRIGTGPTGGSYFPIGGIIANLISSPPGSMACAAGGSCGVPGLIVSAISTEGSVENIVGLTASNLDMALVQADVAKLAYLGQGPFSDEAPHRKLRAIASLHPEAVHVVTRASSGIDSIAKLRGKRVSLGARRSGTRVTAGMVLEGYGLNADAVVPVYEGLSRSADMLADGEIDAFFMVGGYPMPAIQYAAEANSIRLLPVDGENADALLARFPFFSRTVIPADTYHGIAATSTLSVRANLVVDASMDENLVYAVTKALWLPENLQVLNRDLPENLRVGAKEAISGIAVPLHPGAARFYRDAGLPVDNVVSQ
ncbi:MAG: TAXI family TRAP transporter solute-binding subunit [Rhodospirillales bacterium]|nr:TAXI family TRAP transporter solute-binding subunit [Rhodospirillales bacterium]